ncbi:MAG: helix-turn-helix domain-containing protein [Proteobacteria bacterium]|nr:helix-turn-helix domain-containing protein [Pseudomonadota bacterium]
MMMHLDTCTHYEILEIPANASFLDIRKAYKEISSIYDADSISTYSLFTPEERQRILDRADLAFQILGDIEKRKEYDTVLLEAGKVSPEMLVSDKPDPLVPIFHTQLPPGNGHVDRKIKEKISEKEVRVLAQEIQSKELISGQDLKALRMAADIELVEIFEVSRISVNTLEAIESGCKGKLPSPIYLKGFLKSYARFLDLVPEVIIAGYMAYLSRS